MGSCVSTHKEAESAMKFKLSFGSKSEKLVIPSPIKDKPLTNGDAPIGEVGLKPQFSPSYPSTNFRNFGSKEESFFDSRAWLDSDCEDDFFSVNGDFTPSRGSTPVHHSLAMGTPRVNTAAALFEDPVPASGPEPSPTDKKKRLSELFKETGEENEDVEEQNSTCGNPYISGVNSVCSSERSPNGNLRPVREKTVKSVQCCLPSLITSRSFSERKKKMSPPSTASGDK